MHEPTVTRLSAFMGSVFGGLRQQTAKQLRVQPAHDLMSFNLRAIQKVLAGMRLAIRNMPSVGHAFVPKEKPKSPVRKFTKSKGKNKRGGKNGSRSKVAASARVQQGLVRVWFHELLRVGVDTCLRPATRHFMLHEIWAQMRTHLDSNVLSSILRSLYETQSTTGAGKQARSKSIHSKNGSLHHFPQRADMFVEKETLIALQPDDSKETMQVLLTGPINSLVPGSQASEGSSGNKVKDTPDGTEVTGVREQARSSDQKLAQEALARALMDLYHRVWMGDRKHDVGAYTLLRCDTLANPKLTPPTPDQMQSGNQSPSNSLSAPPPPDTSFCMSGFISDLLQVVNAYNHDQLVSARVREQEFRKYERMQRMQRRALIDTTKTAETSDREDSFAGSRAQSVTSLGSPPSTPNLGHLGHFTFLNARTASSPTGMKMDGDKLYENTHAKGLVNSLGRPGRRVSGVIIRTMQDVASNVAEGKFTCT